MGEGDDNCVQCHKSGILPVFPERGTVSPDEEQALLAVNERFSAVTPRLALINMSMNESLVRDSVRLLLPTE